MILLDTCVVSEPLRPALDTRVAEWIDAQALETLFPVCHHGCRAARRRGAAARGQAPGRLAGEPRDAGAAYAALMAKVRASGLPVGSADGYIAAIAAANGLTVATRDTGPFEAAGATVINPWLAQG